jgi:excisionase family DNA binding protein
VTEERKTLTVEETAKVLGVSRDLAYRGVRDGTIPAVRVGSRWVVPRGRLEQLLGERNGGPP